MAGFGDRRSFDAGDASPFRENARAVDTLEAFGAVDIRVGTIVTAEPFPEARKPAYRLTVDFGPAIGVRRSSVQITGRYACEELTGRRVLGVVNFPPKRIAGFTSEVLVLGVDDPDGNVVLIRPDFDDVPNGARLY
jgi:tRNA-binding protein